LSLSNEEIVELLARYDKDSKAIREEILRICWHMRGGISYDDGFMLSDQDRKIISKIIDENIETTKKTGLPYF
jgi:ABC-type antimicrobial peptide transport system permease subunit